LDQEGALFNLTTFVIMHKLISQLTELLQKPLPGSVAHILMSPAGRGNSEDAIESLLAPPRTSAVMVLLFPENDQLYMVLIKRPDYQGVHSGQISFPGGKFEDADVDFVRTAIRETNEEIGVNPNEIQVIGSLSRIYIPPSNFLVYPFVGYCEQKPAFVIDKEVDRVIIIPLDALMDDSIILQGKFLAGGNLNFEINAPYFALDNERVWGATACILSEFKQILQQVKVE
jgi:8-oxo-dGTP pyrophosphatase MutT (NUDIX family)